MILVRNCRPTRSITIIRRTTPRTWLYVALTIVFLLIFAYNFRYLRFLQRHSFFIFSPTYDWNVLPEANVSCGNEQMRFPAYLRGKKLEEGQPFSCSLVRVLESLGIADSNHYGENITFRSDEVVFVTYASSNHFAESREALVQIRQTTNNRIIFFDLGLSSSQLSELSNVCNLETRKLNFDRYPHFARQLMSYQFKVMVMAEVFSSLKAYWVIDASARFVGSPAEFYRKVNAGEIEAFAQRRPTDHSIIAATHPDTYHYLPIDNSLSSLTMLEAGTVFIRKSDFSKEVIKWSLLCALTDGCMNPPNAVLHCEWRIGHFNYYGGCHKYDQSCINIVVSNLLERDGTVPRRNRKTGELKNVLHVKRGQTSYDLLDIPCHGDVFF